jgi:ABC-type molybdate transport system substrate-binding protein
MSRTCGLILALSTAAVAALASGATFGAELKILAIGGMTHVLPQLIPEFETATGHRVSAQYGTPAVVRDRVLKGEQFDVIFGALCSRLPKR